MATGKPLLHVQRNIQRSDAASVKALGQVSTGWIVDANGKRGALECAIRPISEKTNFCGTAFTVRSRGRDNLAAYAALEFAKPGDVLVLATDAYTEASVVGDVFIGMARNLGIVAVVTDGMVRDVAGINAVGIPVFARGLSPNSPYKDGPGELGTQVCVGNMLIASGDIVRGDADGIVVVSKANASAVVLELERIRDQEARMDKWVQDGLSTPPWLQEFLTADKVSYLD
jgi:4-hydroxy-4-methyl-2-oxoglutarate aldolase